MGLRSHSDRCIRSADRFFSRARYPQLRADNILLDMSNSTHEIIERVLAGELDQYRKIVRLFELDVFRVAAPALGSRSAAEDAVQEVFISAYRLLEKFDIEQPFRPWLMGIARNVVRNELRSRSRDSSKLELYSHYLNATTRDEESTQTVDVAAALTSCRERLADVAADAIRGRYDDGLSLDDLAERLQRSATATRQLLYRTRIALRDCIETQLAASGGDA